MLESFIVDSCQMFPLLEKFMAVRFASLGLLKAVFYCNESLECYMKTVFTTALERLAQHKCHEKILYLVFDLTSLKPTLLIAMTICFILLRSK